MCTWLRLLHTYLLTWHPEPSDLHTYIGPIFACTFTKTITMYMCISTFYIRLPKGPTSYAHGFRNTPELDSDLDWKTGRFSSRRRGRGCHRPQSEASRNNVCHVCKIGRWQVTGPRGQVACWLDWHLFARNHLSNGIYFAQTICFAASLPLDNECAMSHVPYA